MDGTVDAVKVEFTNVLLFISFFVGKNYYF